MQELAELGANIELAQGLIGLPDHRHFSLVAGERAGFFWLQSLDDPGLGFVLADPFLHFDGYEVDIRPADHADLGPFARSELLVLTVVALGASELEPTTTNLRGPIAFNLRTRQAKQLVLSDPSIELNAVFDPFSYVCDAAQTG